MMGNRPCKSRSSLSTRERDTLRKKANDHEQQALHFRSNEFYPEALEHYNVSLEIVRKIGHKDAEWRICSAMGHIALKLGQHQNAKVFMARGLKVAQEIGDDKMIADSYFDHGCVFDCVQDYAKSVVYYTNMIEIYQDLQMEKGRLGKCYGNISLAYMMLGKYNDAMCFEEKSLKIFQLMKNRKDEAKSLLNLGDLHEKLKDCSGAFECYNKSLTIAKEINDKRIKAMCYLNLGVLSNTSKKYDDALKNYQKSLQIAKEIGDMQIQARVNLNIAISYSSLQRYREATEHYQEIVKNISETNVQASVYYHWGLAKFHLGELKSAIKLSEKCVNAASLIGDKKQQGDGYHLLGRAYYRRQENDDMDKSEEYLKKAIECYDFLFNQLRNRDQFKISIFERFKNSFKLLTTLLIKAERIQEALLVSDQERARALRDRLTSIYRIPQRNNHSSLQSYADVETLLSKDTFSVLHYSLLRRSLTIWVLSKNVPIQLKETEKQQYVNAVDLLFEENDDSQDATHHHDISGTIARAYAQMKINENVPCRACHRAPNTCKNTQNVRSNGTSKEQNQEETDSLELLYSAIVAPVIQHIHHDEIVIVPEGKMYSIPFPALRNPDTGQYLSDTKRIRLVPSLAILKLLDECPADCHSQQGALVVGDPTVGDVMHRGKKTNFEPLPNARIEADIVALRLHTSSLCGEKATKAMVLRKLQEGSAIIHIAGHGAIDNGEIALAPDVSTVEQGNIPEEKDYLLTIKEIEKTVIKAKLVVLSCCYSGVGEIKSEGVIGVCRAFLAAGARAVLASLWEIYDNSVTLSFMTSFYDYLERGESASVSLHKSMKDIRRQAPVHPGLWAPFFLIGDDVTIDFPSLSAQLRSD